MLHPSSGRPGCFAPLAPSPMAATSREATDHFTHSLVRCDNCGMLPIVGSRYRCSMCANYDLCASCMETFEEQLLSPLSSPTPIHDRTHLFYRLRQTTPHNSSYVVIQNRSACQHAGIRCDGCGKVGLEGYRYQCISCQLDFCEACEAIGNHPPEHDRLKILIPKQQQHPSQQA